MPDFSKDISEALTSIEKVFNNDTEQSVKQLESLRQVNTATTLRLIRKEEELKSLTRRASKIETLNEEINNLLQDLDTVEKKVDFVEKLTKELDDFTKEL